MKGLRQFREHEDYTFKQSERVGKGGHGEVHDICIVNAELKDNHISFANKDVVAKKVIIIWQKIYKSNCTSSVNKINSHTGYNAGLCLM